MSPTVVAYLYLVCAITFEIIGTTFLAKSQEFTRPLPTLASIVLYSISFYLLTKTLRVIPLGIAYALWGGIGICLTALVGLVVFKQAIDGPAVLGIGLIVAGVVVLNLFSSSIG
ncbi:DMT family transporter [Psychrobacter sp. FDAARGOS_221]|uniref:DMT family transporter n=1 Tax=Psychrobacter sp. FDAARGOS_221 TaxID=1975705 RepID=UPI000BB5649B|nr:multidrug efflux SMR transporter [Psychrobacter sp. FDAARGOS_221]PNK60098.1 QacE family quaternary ammonium compound efflux SMR transporter [Psychrobacter sp. FDAARGOS_221]